MSGTPQPVRELLHAYMRNVLGREPCCADDFGGSHYHCTTCGCVIGSHGHGTAGCPPVEDRPAYAASKAWAP